MLSTAAARQERFQASARGGRWGFMPVITQTLPLSLVSVPPANVTHTTAPGGFFGMP